MFQTELGLRRLFRPLINRSDVLGTWHPTQQKKKTHSTPNLFIFSPKPPILSHTYSLQWVTSKKKPTVGKHLPPFSLLISALSPLAKADFLCSGRKDTAGDGMANVKVKGENFYRDAKKVGQLNMYKEGKPIRNKNGDILKAASFQSREIPNARIEPNRKWFGMYFSCSDCFHPLVHWSIVLLTLASSYRKHQGNIPRCSDLLPGGNGPEGERSLSSAP